MGNIISAAIFLPLIGFVISGGFGRFMPKMLVGAISTLVVLCSFVCSIILFNNLSESHTFYKLILFKWIHTGNIDIEFSFLADKLSVWMMLIITGVGSLIHLYSIGYMHSDKGFHKFFAYLNLFIFSMLTLVLGANYVMLFFGWEGVGLCSYLLIGFWYENTENGYAARKAFIMNRIGDLGLLLGIFTLFNQIGTTDFHKVFGAAGSFSNGTLEIICILLFIGAIGKSAQIPLFTWLPDAMAGPTPVSALIHAATMVTAGIYLIARSGILFVNAEMASTLVLIIGMLTALIASTIALKQNDIKKVLAYSTVSQLGYMFVALGVGAYTTALFHVTTHAFFKALLFLGSGSVIHAMGGEQDIRKMGGLKQKLKITHLTFLIGTLAISGVPMLSGFFSKDEILAKSLYGLPTTGSVVFTVLAITSLFTAIYMFRMYFLTFYGNFRGTEDQKHHLHESPLNMTIPLMVLAFLSITGGVLGLSSIFSHHHFMNDYFSKLLYDRAIPHPSHFFEWTVLVVSAFLLAIVIFLTHKKYVNQGFVPVKDEDEKGLEKVLGKKYYLDEIYQYTFLRPVEWLGKVLYKIFDRSVIDGVVNFSGNFALSAGKTLRKVQNGNIESYLLAMVIGVVACLILIQII
ncbi:MAG: NADH-quinone oxidoreductase subunit L [Flavobacteriales bacterium]|nr:NADH-quinone oxidoreductase subunit L [Flavobacteriales bacterium]